MHALLRTARRPSPLAVVGSLALVSLAGCSDAGDQEPTASGSSGHSATTSAEQPSAEESSSASPSDAAPEPGEASPSGSPAPSGGSAEHPQDLPIVRRDADDPAAVGEVDAPVVLSVWTDPRCPFCAEWVRDTLPTVIEEYADTGKVRIEFHEVAYFGEQSHTASVAALAAGEQGRHLEYLQAMYADAPESGHPDLPRRKLLEFAEAAKVPDLERFEQDLDSPELDAAARRESEEARALGVQGVPFFVAGRSALSGAQPAEVFREYLDEAVEQADDPLEPSPSAKKG